MEKEELELIARQTQVLEKLDIIEAARGSALEQLLILAKEREKRELESVNFTYPDDGTVAELEAGITKLDFYTGKIVNTKDEVSKFASSRSLQNAGKPWLRSYAVNANKAIGVQIGDEDTMYFEDGFGIGKHVKFKKMKILTGDVTEIFIQVSTNPYTTLELTSDRTRIAVAEIAEELNFLTVTEHSDRLTAELLQHPEEEG